MIKYLEHIFVLILQTKMSSKTVYLILFFQFYLMLSIPNFLGVNHVLTQPILCKIEALSIQVLK